MIQPDKSEKAVSPLTGTKRGRGRPSGTPQSDSTREAIRQASIRREQYKRDLRDPSPEAQARVHAKVYLTPEQVARRAECQARKAQLDREWQWSQARIANLQPVRDMASALISIGYKLLAQRYHPDRCGGDSAQMSLLNQARARLLTLVDSDK